MLYHCSTSLYFTPHYSTIVRLDCSLLYINLPWLYFTLLQSTLLYHGSTSFYFTLHYPTIPLLQSTLLCISLPRLYFTLYMTLQWLHFTVLDSTLFFHGSTSVYFALHYSTMDLLQCTGLYITLPWLYFTLPDYLLLYHGST